MKTRPTRALALLASLVATFVAACGGDGGAGTDPVGRQVLIALAPTFDGPDRVPPALDPVTLRATVTNLTGATQFYSETFDVVPGSVFEDNLDFEVPSGTSQVVLTLQLSAQDGSPVWAAGPDTIVVPEEGEIGVITPVFQWVGPGSGAARLVLSPAEVALDAGDDTTLVVTAFDQNGDPIDGTTAAIDWVSESTELGDFVDQTGRWQSNGNRGEVRVIATLSPQQLSDTSLIIVQPAPSALEVTGGVEQTAPAGSTLSSPVEVQVLASDGGPLAGRTVLFEPQNGGSVGQTAVVSDAEGLARTSWTLGTEVGTQTLRMQLEGRPEIFATVEATATAVEFQAPTGVTSTPESGGAPAGGIEVAWVSDDPNVEIFRVERSLDGGVSWSLVDGQVAGEDRSLVDAGPGGSWDRDREVLHRVQGCNLGAEGCSGWTVSSAAAYTLPNAPGGLDVSVAEILPAGPVLFVQWIDTNVHETGYDVCDADSVGGSCTVQSLPADETSVRFTTAVSGDSVFVTVTARNPAGEAESSAWVAIATFQDFSISIVSGDGQSGIVDSGLNDPLVVEVRDPFGALASGVNVTFTALNGGVATPGSGTTDAAGQAATTWTLGPATGTQHLIAELAEASSVFVQFSADAAFAAIGAPTNVAASPSIPEGSFDGFTVSWESSDPNAERFRVERLLNGGEWTTVADSLGSADRDFFDGDSFAADREVTYRVQACDFGGTNCSGFGVAADPVYTPPAAPSAVSAQIQGTNGGGVVVSTSWTDNNSFADLYSVCARALPTDVCTVQAVPPGTGTVTFSTAVPDSVYITVIASNPTDQTSSSIWFSLAPPAPTSVVAEPLVEEGTLTGFDLSWTIGGPGSASYEVERSLDGGVNWQAGVDDPNIGSGQFFDIGFGSWGLDHEFIYRVRGCNVSACGAWSAVSDPVYTLPAAPTGLSAEWVEIIQDGPMIDLFWTDTNSYEDGYEICDSDGFIPCDSIIVLGPDVENKFFRSVVEPFLDSMLVELRAFNATGYSDPAEIWIQLPGVAAEGISFFSATTGSRSAPWSYLGLLVDNLEFDNLYVGSLNGSLRPLVCALNAADTACGSDMDVEFLVPVWDLIIDTGDDTASGIQGQLEIDTWDGFEITTEVVDLIVDGDPTTTDEHDLSSFGTIVGITLIPAAGSEFGITDFTFDAAAGQFPEPPLFAPASDRTGATVRERGR